LQINTIKLIAFLGYSSDPNTSGFWTNHVSVLQTRPFIMHAINENEFFSIQSKSEIIGALGSRRI